jgi:hypothetical protein
VASSSAAAIALCGACVCEVTTNCKESAGNNGKSRPDQAPASGSGGASVRTRVARCAVRYSVHYLRGVFACVLQRKGRFGAAPSSASLTKSKGLIAAVSTLHPLHTPNCTPAWTVAQRGRLPGRDRICLAIMWVS